MSELITTPKPHQSIFRRAVSIFLLLGLGLFIGRYVVPVEAEGQIPLRLIAIEEGKRQLVFPTFWEAWDKLHANYLESLDDKDLLYGAVEGMVRASGDPYTAFADPEETKQFEENLQGSFSGVGIEIGMQNGLVTVISPLEGSPAEQAGIQQEDIIVAVNDEPITQNMNIDEVVDKIRGPRGETVKLTILRKDENETKDISVMRDTISIESVKFSMVDGIAHIELKSFNGDTTQQFTEIANAASEQGAKGIILDVRGNPGGFLQTAVDISSFFLDRGEVVVKEKGKEEEDYEAKGNAMFRDMPVVVLIDRGSASASEIVAGALQDQRNVPVIGVQSFGKGSVQELIKLKDGSSLRVTVAKWFTPNDRSISDEGIKPNIEVTDNRDTEEDEVLQRALEELKKNQTA